MGGKIVPSSGREVIDDRDLVAPCEQTVGDVRTDKTSAAGNEYSHGVWLGVQSTGAAAFTYRLNAASRS